MIVRDPRIKTGWSRTGPGPAKNLKRQTRQEPKKYSNLRPDQNRTIFPNHRQIRSDWSPDQVVRGSLFIEMSEEVILVKSEDDENVPKSPVYLSETTSESSKPDAVSVIR